MVTTSISNIKSSLATLQETLPNFKKYLKAHYSGVMNVSQGGKEKVYSPNDLLDALQNIIRALTYLVEDSLSYHRLSLEVRKNIQERLLQLTNDVKNFSLSNIIASIEDIEQSLSPYNQHTDLKSMITLQQKKDELSKQSEHLTHILEEVREKERSINSILNVASEQAETISTKKETIATLLKQSKTAQEQLNSLKKDLETAKQEIRTLGFTSSMTHDEITEHRDKVKELAEDINEHQKKIKKQETQFEVFQETLDKNTTEQSKYLEEARKLIEESKLALNYTTSVGLSASFDAQCKYLTGKWGYKLWGWLVASVVSILGIIAIGVWLITTEHSQGNRDYSLIWIQIFGKLSMIPLLVTATIFCANQYSKQKVLLADYSYKLRLAQSMVAFSEELREKDSEKYKEYLSSVLKEILKDPLRTRIDPNKSSTTKGDVLISKDSLPLLEKLISLVQKATHVS